MSYSTFISGLRQVLFFLLIRVKALENKENQVYMLVYFTNRVVLFLHMALQRLPHLILMAGHAGTGKTTFSRLFLSKQLHSPGTWAFLDKDTIAGDFTKALMMLHTGDASDRDSPVFSEKVRPLEYAALQSVAMENLDIGISCIVCAPFGQECKTLEAYEAYIQQYTKVANVLLVWSHVSTTEAKRRIELRNHPMDQYKLAHWEKYAKRRYNPDWIVSYKSAIVLNSAQDEKTTLSWLQGRVS